LLRIKNLISIEAASRAYILTELNRCTRNGLQISALITLLDAGVGVKDLLELNRNIAFEIIACVVEKSTATQVSGSHPKTPPYRAIQDPFLPRLLIYTQSSSNSTVTTKTWTLGQILGGSPS
jgi:hypothetical protein